MLRRVYRNITKEKGGIFLQSGAKWCGYMHEEVSMGLDFFFLSFYIISATYDGGLASISRRGVWYVQPAESQRVQ